jgi:hypothetical protein
MLHSKYCIPNTVVFLLITSFKSTVCQRIWFNGVTFLQSLGSGAQAAGTSPARLMLVGEFSVLWMRRRVRAATTSSSSSSGGA